MNGNRPVAEMLDAGVALPNLRGAAIPELTNRAHLAFALVVVVPSVPAVSTDCVSNVTETSSATSYSKLSVETDSLAMFSALVADHAPRELRGTAFGAFNLAAGIAVFAGSWGMGLLWDAVGPAAAF